MPLRSRKKRADAMARVVDAVRRAEEGQIDVEQAPRPVVVRYRPISSAKGRLRCFNQERSGAVGPDFANCGGVMFNEVWGDRCVFSNAQMDTSGQR